MKKTIKLFGIIALVAATVFSVIGCDDPKEDINGTWVYDDDEEWKFDNGNFEASLYGNPNTKGTYTTNGNKLTITITHIHGSAINGLQSRWYSKSELVLILPSNQLDQLNILFRSVTFTYSVDGNKLILTDGSPTTILTKR